MNKRLMIILVVLPLLTLAWIAVFDNIRRTSGSSQLISTICHNGICRQTITGREHRKY